MGGARERGFGSKLFRKHLFFISFFALAPSGRTCLVGAFMNDFLRSRGLGLCTLVLLRGWGLEGL